MRRKNFPKIFILGLIVLVIAILYIFGVFSFSKRSGIMIERFVYEKTYFLRQELGNLKDYFSTRQSFIDENEKLTTEKQQLILENANLKVEEKENELLRQNLNFLKQKKYDYVLAEIIGKSGQVVNTGEIFIIDKGQEDGVGVGDAVIYISEAQAKTLNGFLIGKIIKVNNFSADVLTIRSSESAIAASVLAEKLVDGLVRGANNLSLVLDLIPLDKKIQENDLVVTSGLEKNIPKGLVIGQIETITQKPSDLFQKASLKSLIDFNEVRMVIILKSENENR